MWLKAKINDFVGRAGYTVYRSYGSRRSDILNRLKIEMVLDVGAAKGSYGMELRRLGYVGEIVSFEPLDAAYALLLDASKSDPKWTSVKTALGDSESKSVINVAGNSDSSSLLPMLSVHSNAAPQADFVGTQEVNVQTLDFLMEGKLNAPSNRFIKIDTQGFEKQVLNGAMRTLASVAAVELEMSLVPLYEGGMLISECIDLMANLGFVPHWLEPGFRDPATQQLLQMDGIFVRNVD